MQDHTRMPGPTRDREALDIDDVQALLSNALKAVQEIGAAMAAATVRANLAEQQHAAMVEERNDAQWGPTTAAPPWQPNPGVEGKVTLSEAVGQALGTASMAWTPHPDGIFDSQEAVRVYEGIMAWLSNWMSEQVKQANEATAAKMVATMKEYRDGFAHGGGRHATINGLIRKILAEEEEE